MRPKCRDSSGAGAAGLVTYAKTSRRAFQKLFTSCKRVLISPQRVGGIRATMPTKGLTLMSETLRLTGRLVSMETKRGTSENGRDYSFVTGVVAVSPFNRTNVTLDEAVASKVFEGSDVDLIVQVSTNKQGYQRISALDLWPVAALA